MATNQRVIVMGSVVGGGLLLAWLASREKASAAAASGDSPADPFAPGMTPPQLAAVAAQDQYYEDKLSGGTVRDQSGAHVVPSSVGPSVGPVRESPDPASSKLPSVPLQPVHLAPAVSAPSSSIPAPKMPPITVKAEAGNVVKLPAAPAPTAASAKRAPLKAAQELLAYVKPILSAKRGSELGTKGAPNSFVKAAQLDMGLEPDGIYGPDTRARGKQLLGVTFPARV